MIKSVKILDCAFSFQILVIKLNIPRWLECGKNRDSIKISHRVIPEH